MPPWVIRHTLPHYRPATAPNPGFVRFFDRNFCILPRLGFRLLNSKHHWFRIIPVLDVGCYRNPKPRFLQINYFIVSTYLHGINMYGLVTAYPRSAIHSLHKNDIPVSDWFFDCQNKKYDRDYMILCCKATETISSTYTGVPGPDLLQKHRYWHEMKT